MTPRATWTALLLVCAAARNARGEVQTTLAASGQAGASKYLSSTYSLTVAPSKQVSLDLTGGRSRSASLISDSSIGGGVWVEVAPRLSLSLHLDRYNGEKGYTEDLRTGDFLYDNVKAQQTNTVTVGAVAKVFGGVKNEDADADEHADDDAEADRLLQAVRLSGGGSWGTLHVPVTTIGPLGRKTSADYNQKQSSGSIGFVAVVTETELGVTYKRNHYGELAPPAGISALAHPRLAVIAEQIRTSVNQVLTEPVAYDTVFSLTEPLPHDVSIYASFDYAILEISRGIARTTTAELTWDLAKWLGIKGGGEWVHEQKATTTYFLGGVELYF